MKKEPKSREKLILRRESIQALDGGPRVAGGYLPGSGGEDCSLASACLACRITTT
jgi:hypothetical protein